MMRLPRCLTDGSSGGVQVGADVSGRSVDRGGPGGGHKSGSPRVPGRGGSWPRGETFFRIMDLGNRGGPGLFLPETLTEVGSHSRCFSISQGECFGPGEDLTVLVTIGHSMGIGSARLTPNVQTLGPHNGSPLRWFCCGGLVVHIPHEFVRKPQRSFYHGGTSSRDIAPAQSGPPGRRMLDRSWVAHCQLSYRLDPGPIRTQVVPILHRQSEAPLLPSRGPPWILCHQGRPGRLHVPRLHCLDSSPPSHLGIAHSSEVIDRYPPSRNFKAS